MNLKIVVALIATVMALQQAASAPAMTAHTLETREGTRQYLVMQPPGAKDGVKPLLILLHGHGGSGEFMLGQRSIQGYSSQGWQKLAEREQLLLIAPQGTIASDQQSAWNDCRGDASTNAKTDDVAFISALIDAAVREHRADPARVYVFGYSNGGGLAYRLGIELRPRLAAVAVQSTLMAANSSCKPPASPLPIFISHGTQDDVMPYAGGAIGGADMQGRGTGLGAEASVAIWRRLDGLPEQPVVYRFPQMNPSSATSATRFVWGDDPAGLQVCFLRIDGGGHVHASKTEDFPLGLRKLVGEMNHDVDTVEEVWAFFRDKRAPAK